MGDLMKAIKERRTIRNYEDKPIPDQILEQLLEAIRWAPSWANTQVWEVIVIKQQEIKEKLRETLSKGNPAGKAMVTAPVVLALCAKTESSGYYDQKVTTKFGDWLMYDLGLANQNLCLAAHDLGLGTVIVGLYNHDEAAKVLGVPEGYELVSLVPVGWPGKVPPAPRRREVKDFVHYDRF